MRITFCIILMSGIINRSLCSFLLNSDIGWNPLGRVFKGVIANQIGNVMERRLFAMHIPFTKQLQSVQLLSRIRLFATPWTAACQASPSITNSRSIPKAMSIESVIPSNHLILCNPLLLLPSIFPSIRVFSNSQLFSSGGQSIGVSSTSVLLLGEDTDWNCPPLARHHSNHLHELFYDRRSW